MEKITITTPYITLGQFLKFINIAASGGEIKAILAEGLIRVDGEPETRRGKKLYPGQKVNIEGSGTFEVEHAKD